MDLAWINDISPDVSMRARVRPVLKNLRQQMVARLVVSSRQLSVVDYFGNAHHGGAATTSQSYLGLRPAWFPADVNSMDFASHCFFEPLMRVPLGDPVFEE